jgi:hypothetical protein
MIGTLHGLTSLWSQQLRSIHIALMGQHPMKRRWTIAVCIATLAGCAGPQISVTDVSPRRVGFLVQNAWRVPMQDVDEQAANHCQQQGLSYRRIEAVWISPTLRRVDYECGSAQRPSARKPEVRRAATAKPASDDPKLAAWTKAKAATEAWALCLRFGAERKAKETADAPRLVAQQVVGACAGLEQAVHEPLQAVGEDSSRFQADLHEQAVQNASDRVTMVRKTGVPVSAISSFAQEDGR